MKQFRTCAEDLPDSFPIFPLAGALLLPHGRLPLNIFEPRYMTMIDDSLAAGRLFGMVQPEPGALPTPGGPALFKVGCLGRLASFSETDDGRFLITLHGVIRFALVEELGLMRGYRRVRGDYTPFLGDLEPPPSSDLIDRAHLLQELRAYFQRTGVEANWDAINRMSDDMLLVTLCMVCPFEPAEKQALLEAASIQERAETLLALLQMGGLDMPESGQHRAVS